MHCDSVKALVMLVDCICVNALISLVHGNCVKALTVRVHCNCVNVWLFLGLYKHINYPYGSGLCNGFNYLNITFLHMINSLNLWSVEQHSKQQTG